MAYPFTEINAAQIGVVHRGAIPYFVQYMKVTASALGVTTVIPAPTVSGQQIVILDLCITHSGSVNWNLQSHVTTGVATGLFYGTAGPPIFLSDSVNGLFACVPGEACDINLSAATAVGGLITYVMMPLP